MVGPKQAALMRTACFPYRKQTMGEVAAVQRGGNQSTKEFKSMQIVKGHAGSVVP